MTTVPYTFGSESSPIPLSQLDANFAVTPQFANTAGNVVNAAQANITSVGTLTSVSVSGNVNSGNLRTTGSISATGNIVAGNVSTGGTVSVFGTVTGGSFTTAGTASAIGTVTAGNVLTGGLVSATGNITGGNVTTAGQVSAQGNIQAQGIISAVGNIVTDANFVGNFLGNITGNLSVGGANTQVLFNLNGNVGAAGGLTYNSGSNTLSILGVVSAQGNVNAGGNLSVGGNLQVTGITQLVGVTTAPTAPTSTSNNQVASTAFVNNAINQNALSVSITGGVISNVALSGSGISSSEITGGNISSSVITGGNISGLTSPLPVASGGIGAITLTANALVVGNGASAPTSISPGTSGNILKSNGTNWTSQVLKGLGLGGETWNNVTSSRSSGTTYTNSFSYPIVVSATGSFANGGPSLDIYVDNILVSTFNWQFNGAGARSGGSAIVPPGSTYRLVFNGSGIQNWVELY
jgi:hypothetical protein